MRAALGHPELLERLKKASTASASAFLKDSKAIGRKAMLPAPSYKPTLLGEGKVGKPGEGHLPLERFLELCVQGAREQRAKDGKALQDVYSAWALEPGSGAGFDTFADMLEAASPEMPEKTMIELYQQASLSSHLTITVQSPVFTCSTPRSTPRSHSRGPRRSHSGDLGGGP